MKDMIIQLSEILSSELVKRNVLVLLLDNFMLDLIARHNTTKEGETISTSDYIILVKATEIFFDMIEKLKCEDGEFITKALLKETKDTFKEMECNLEKLATSLY